MGKLGILIYIIAAPTMAGSAMVAVLVQRGYTEKMVVISALIGALAAIPVSWYVRRQIKD